MSMAIDEMKCSIREEKAFSIAKNLLQLHIHLMNICMLL